MPSDRETSSWLRMVLEQYLTAAEQEQIMAQLTAQSWLVNRQVLWSGMQREAAQEWADHNGMQTLTTAMGPLMNINDPACRKKTKCAKQWTLYVRGASVVFAWFITHYDLVTVLSPPAPVRFNPRGGTNLQMVERPVIERALRDSGKSLKIMIVHPACEGPAASPYQLWPHDEITAWSTEYASTAKATAQWRAVKISPDMELVSTLLARQCKVSLGAFTSDVSIPTPVLEHYEPDVIDKVIDAPTASMTPTSGGFVVRAVRNANSWIQSITLGAAMLFDQLTDDAALSVGDAGCFEETFVSVYESADLRCDSVRAWTEQSFERCDSSPSADQAKSCRKMFVEHDKDSQGQDLTTPLLTKPRMFASAGLVQNTDHPKPKAPELADRTGGLGKLQDTRTRLAAEVEQLSREQRRRLDVLLRAEHAEAVELKRQYEQAMVALNLRMRKTTSRPDMKKLQMEAREVKAAKKRRVQDTLRRQRNQRVSVKAQSRQALKLLRSRLDELDRTVSKLKKSKTK